MTAEEKMAQVRDFRLIDDVFFEVFAEDKEACQEMLRVLLEDDGLTVLDVVVQSSKRNIYGRSVRLDALCTLGNGKKCNIEVQRADDDDHFRRVRFNAASITVKDSEPGERFEELLDLYIVYISEHDFIHGGHTTYHVDKVIRETGGLVDDGLQEVYVNAKVKDGSKISELMDCFTQRDVVDNKKFPAVSKRVRELKTTEGGASAVCDIVQKLVDEGRVKGHAEGRAEGRAEGILDTLFSLLADGVISVSDALKRTTVPPEEFQAQYKAWKANH